MIVRQTIFWMLYTTSGARCVERASVRLICIFFTFFGSTPSTTSVISSDYLFLEKVGIFPEWSGVVRWSSVRIRRGGLPSFCRKIKDRKHDSQSTDGTLPPSPPHTHFFYTKKPINGRQAGRGRR